MLTPLLLPPKKTPALLADRAPSGVNIRNGETPLAAAAAHCVSGGELTAATSRWERPSQYPSGRLDKSSPSALIQSGRSSWGITWWFSRTTSSRWPQT